MIKSGTSLVLGSWPTTNNSNNTVHPECIMPHVPGCCPAVTHSLTRHQQQRACWPAPTPAWGSAIPRVSVGAQERSKLGVSTTAHTCRAWGAEDRGRGGGQVGRGGQVKRQGAGGLQVEEGRGWGCMPSTKRTSVLSPPCPSQTPPHPP